MVGEKFLASISEPHQVPVPSRNSSRVICVFDIFDAVVVVVVLRIVEYSICFPQLDDSRLTWTVYRKTDDAHMEIIGIVAAENLPRFRNTLSPRLVSMKH